MKGVYFWIGVLLFVACAYIFLAEHGKFYEFFDGTADPSGTPSTGGTDASGNPVPPSANTSPAPPSNGPGLANTAPPATSTGTAGPTSPAPPSYGPGLAMSGSGTAPQGNLAPGSTTTNPTTSTPSQQDFNVLQYAVNSFSSAVDAYSGGKAGVLGKLSPGDATYFNTLYAMIASLGPNADPSTFPFSSAQTASKIVEFQKATQYITTQLPNDTKNANRIKRNST